MINSWDFDGVISIGIYPGPDDIIITGRCLDEASGVEAWLKERGIKNKVYFNPMFLVERGNHTIESRIFSGKHKANVLAQLYYTNGKEIQYHFEDDPIQIEIIRNLMPPVEVIEIKSPTQK
jgi:hypothetical protein